MATGPGGAYDDEMTEVRQPRRQMQPMYGGYGGGWGRGGGYRQHIETKPFFLTSEFWACVAVIAGLGIAAGTSDDIDARLFWLVTAAITIGYAISRGIAKSGTKSRSWDPREEGMQRLRDRASRQGSDA